MFLQFIEAAFGLHWYRCMWVLGLWHSATENEVEISIKRFSLFIFLFSTDGVWLSSEWEQTRHDLRRA